MREYQFLPSLSLDEYEALRESIREKGVIEPVVTDEEGNVIDGHHRVKACEELGVKYPTRIIAGFSEEQKQDLSVELNMHRRHLTKEQKKELAVNLRKQGWTQERIGKALGVPQQTISRWFTHLSNPDQPSPKSQPDPEIIRLKKEIEAREESEKRLEQEAERQIAEERRKHEAEALLLRRELEEARTEGPDKSTQNLEEIIAERVEKGVAEEIKRRRDNYLARQGTLSGGIFDDVANQKLEEIIAKRVEAELAAHNDLEKRQAREIEQLRQELEKAQTNAELRLVTENDRLFPQERDEDEAETASEKCSKCKYFKKGR
jgi:ParB-like chromosome segregation protein Spo0J